MGQLDQHFLIFLFPVFSLGFPLLGFPLLGLPLSLARLRISFVFTDRRYFFSRSPCHLGFPKGPHFLCCDRLSFFRPYRWWAGMRNFCSNQRVFVSSYRGEGI